MQIRQLGTRMRTDVSSWAISSAIFTIVLSFQSPLLAALNLLQFFYIFAPESLVSNGAPDSSL